MGFFSNYIYEYKTGINFYNLGWADGYAAYEESEHDAKEIIKQLYGHVDELELIGLVKAYLSGFEDGLWLSVNAGEIHNNDGMLYGDLFIGGADDASVESQALFLLDKYKESLKAIDVAYLDYDGVIKTEHKNNKSAIEEQVRILSFICKALNLKVVLSTNRKKVIDPITFATEDEEMKFFLECMKKYGVSLIGMTPVVEATYKGEKYDSWKDYEIIKHLEENPNIKHYCVLDDGGFIEGDANLDLVRNHLVKTLYSSKVASAEGLGYEHIQLIEDIMKLPNDIDVKKDELEKMKIRRAS